MKKLLLALSATALMSNINVALATDYGSPPGKKTHPTGLPTKLDTLSMKVERNNRAMNNQEMRTQPINTVSDSVITKDKFLPYHEAMFTQMKKNINGTADLPSIDMMCGNHDKFIITDAFLKLD